MKKIITILLVVVLAFSCLLVLTSCGGEVKEGHYKYENAWTAGKFYGVKVNVTVSGDKIKKVELVDDAETGWTSCTPTWENKAVWEDGVDDFLASFKGKTASEVKAIKVTCGANGQPNAISGFDFITGSTQGCGRAILAIQNALGAETSDTYIGSYKYENPWSAGSYYGAKAYVAIRDGKISNVTLESDESTGWVNCSAGWTERQIWLDGEANFLKSFVGKTPAEVNAAKVTCAESGQPSAVSGFGYVTGSTQGSGRVILAIQDALKKVQ